MPIDVWLRRCSHKIGSEAVDGGVPVSELRAALAEVSRLKLALGSNYAGLSREIELCR